MWTLVHYDPATRTGEAVYTIEGEGDRLYAVTGNAEGKMVRKTLLRHRHDYAMSAAARMRLPLPPVTFDPENEVRL